MLLRQREQPRGERVEPAWIGGGQGAGKECKARGGAHRGEVGEIDREDLVAEAAGIGAGEEVPALDHHVDGEHQVEALAGPHDGGIVAYQRF